MSNLIQGSKDSVDEEHPGALECQALVSNLVPLHSDGLSARVSPSCSVCPRPLSFYVSCLTRRGLRAGLRFPTDPRPLNAEDSWTGACYAAWHLALFPRELGSLLWRVCRVQREVGYFCADCRSPVSICKMQRRAQRDSYGTFDFDTFVALFNSGTLRHPVTAQFACHKRA